MYPQGIHPHRPAACDAVQSYHDTQMSPPAVGAGVLDRPAVRCRFAHSPGRGGKRRPPRGTSRAPSPTTGGNVLKPPLPKGGWPSSQTGPGGYDAVTQFPPRGIAAAAYATNVPPAHLLNAAGTASAVEGSIPQYTKNNTAEAAFAVPVLFFTALIFYRSSRK